MRNGKAGRTWKPRGNLTVGYSADRGTSYKYRYDHYNRLTHVGKITGGSNPNWTTTDAASFTLDLTGDCVAHASRANAVRSPSRQEFTWDALGLRNWGDPGAPGPGSDR